MVTSHLCSRQLRSCVIGLVALMNIMTVSSSLLEAAPPTVVELTAAIRRDRDAFFAHGSYKFSFRVDSEIRDGGTFAYKSFDVTNIRRSADMHTIVHYPKGSLRGQKDFPEHTKHLVFFGGSAIDYDGSFMQLSPSLFTQHFSYHQYTDYQHINAYKELPPAAGNLSPFEITQPFLPETIAKSPNLYHVREVPEIIDGATCWILERPEVDLIWVDSAGLIHQRLLYWGKGQTRSVLSRSLQFKTVAPGLKLPSKLVVDHFTNPSIDPQPEWDKIAYVLNIELKKSEFDTVKDEDFLVKPVVGDTVNDYIRRVQYRVPAPGEKPFESAIKVAALDQTPKSYYFILANGLLFGLLLIALMVRKVRKAHRTRPTSIRPA